MFFTGKSPESEAVDKCVENLDREKKIFCKQSDYVWIILRIMIWRQIRPQIRCFAKSSYALVDDRGVFGLCFRVKFSH